MGELRALPPPKHETNESVVSALEDMLERARRGEVIGVLILANFRTALGSRRAGRWSFAELLYVIESWKHAHFQREIELVPHDEG